jgi:hypothetical protein
MGIVAQKGEKLKLGVLVIMDIGLSAPQPNCTW